MPNWFGYLSDFVDASENLIMTDDVATPSDSPVAPVENEELEKTSFDMNVFQWSREKKPSRRMVHTRIDRLAWDW